MSRAAMRPGGCGTRPMIESAVTLLPQPDSPTMPRVRPRSRRKSTPSTARTTPRSEAKCVCSPRTSRRSATSLLEILYCAFYLVPVEDAPGARLARAAAEVGDEALLRLPIEPPQLGERLGVVVDAQAQLRVLLGAMDDQRRRLLAALVAGGGFARLERRDQPLGEGQGKRGFRGSGRFLNYFFVGEHVARHGVAVSGPCAAPVDALCPSVLADAAGGVDHVEL